MKPLKDLRFTLDELKGYLKPLIRFGKMELEISDHNEGKRIQVFERDEYSYIDEKGKTIQDGDLTLPLVLYTDKYGVISFIEHHYNAFTNANRDDIIYILGLIGKAFR